MVAFALNNSLKLKVYWLSKAEFIAGAPTEVMLDPVKTYNAHN